jgi:mRNA-degrading endonuclease RelE of RelBE toxin-antitoxin system
MKVEVRVTRNFRKETKSLLKKYASLHSEIAALEKSLTINPTQGTPLGHSAYKIRIAIKSKRKGKSGGGRIITFLQSEAIGFVERKEGMIVVNLLSIYDKSEIDTISDKELKDLIASMQH